MIKREIRRPAHAALAVLLAAMCLVMSGCRTRTTPGTQPGTGETGAAADAGMPAEEILEQDGEADEQKKNGDEGTKTKENPEASRKEYDENAPAEIIPGTDRTVYGEGEGGGASAPGTEEHGTAEKLNSTAEETAVRTEAAEEADRTGTAEDAGEADSAAAYFTILLQERASSLYECRRQSVYWETAEDHVTIFKTSPEHELIQEAGANDVSARLLAENLRVDDGWISRKNPGVVVKVAGRGVLGTGTTSAGAAQSMMAGLAARSGWAGLDAVRNGRVLLISEELLGTPYLRTAAALMVAKCAYPDLYADVDIAKALEMLAEEAAGSVPAGIYYFTGGF